MTRKRVAILLAVFLGASVLSFAPQASASHYWYCSGSTPWKYANYTVYFYNGAPGDWYYVYQEETFTDSNSWNPYTDLAITQVGAAGSSDHANAYAGYYGATGWLGLAQINRTSGCTILQGTAYLNRSYLDGYSRTARKHVACQEVGHLWGLNHVYTATCMNDSVTSYPYPNAHDRDAINAIY
ncbi:MAG TPA: hypothetical protein VHJ34_01645 [Actinomycetota bacterium]|nr:hypothetical protein [Actinomycetota bacterium]